MRGVAPDLIVYFGGLYWRSVGTVGGGKIHTFENDTGPDGANHAENGLIIWRPAGGANGVITGTPGGVAGVGSVCDFDLSTWQIGSRTIWTPVAGLDFTGEVLYTNIDQNHSGFLFTTAAQGLKPPASYELKDQGILTGLLRVQRNW